jgi:GT2 family glycosyltransferase
VKANGAPLISVIIVNWNGRKWLKQCLDSLLAQTYKAYEIILVDNASTDGSAGFVRKHYPNVKLIENDTNDGFAGGNNLGYKHVKGSYILLLNNDTAVEPDFLTEFLKAFDQIPNLGSVQSKLVLMKESSKLDVAGSYWTSSTFLYHYGYGKDQSADKYNRMLPFFSNKGAAMLISRAAIERVGLFDDDFWCYYEETDLCNRLWLAGYECWYFPQAVTFHAMGGTSLLFNNDYVQFHNFKNKLLSFLKNYQTHTLITVLPIYVSVSIALSFVWLVSGKPRHFLAVYKSFLWNINHLKATLEKRRQIQKLRKVSDKAIFKKVKYDPSLSYYYHLFNNSLDKYEDATH